MDIEEQYLSSVIDKIEMRNDNVESPPVSLGDQSFNDMPLSITPLNINKSFKSSLFGGYNKREVDDFLSQSQHSIQLLEQNLLAIDAQKNYLQLQISQLQSQLETYHKLESSIQNSLISAESYALEKRNEADAQADSIIENANKNANRIISEALLEAKKTIENLESVRREAYTFRARMKMMIQAQMELFDEDVENE